MMLQRQHSQVEGDSSRICCVWHGVVAAQIPVKPQCLSILHRHRVEISSPRGGLCVERVGVVDRGERNPPVYLGRRVMVVSITVPVPNLLASQKIFQVRKYFNYTSLPALRREAPLGTSDPSDRRHWLRITKA